METLKRKPNEQLASFGISSSLTGHYIENNQFDLAEIKIKSVRTSTKILGSLIDHAVARDAIDVATVMMVIISSRANGRKMFKKKFLEVFKSPSHIRILVDLCFSGLLNRKSLGTVVKNSINDWLNKCPEIVLVEGSIDKSGRELKDIINLTRPLGITPGRISLFRSILGMPKTTETDNLLGKISKFTNSPDMDVPSISNLRLFSSISDPIAWIKITRSLKPLTLLYNLKFLLSHDIVDIGGHSIVSYIAKTLSDSKFLSSLKMPPYIALRMYYDLENCPEEIKEALNVTLLSSINNFPSLIPETIVALDNVSSMSSPIVENSKISYYILGLLIKMCASTNSTVSLSDIRSKVSVETSESCPSRTLGLFLSTNRSIKSLIIVSDTNAFFDKNSYGLLESKFFKDLKVVCINLNESLVTKEEQTAASNVLHISGFSYKTLSICQSFLSSSVPEFISS